MDDLQKRDISDSLPWLWPPGVELFPHRASIEHLNALLPIKQLRILEPGCFEGYTSVYLAKLGAQVTAFDVRPMNVVRAFARSLYHDVRLDLHVGDAREIARLYAPDSYDLVFHAGLLYHMRAPAEHLRQVAKLAPYVFLDTHIALEDRVTNPGLGEITEHDGLKGRWYAELGWRDELSGAEEQSFWLTEEALRRLCESCELSVTKLSRSDDTPNGPRIAWLLRRAALLPRP